MLILKVSKLIMSGLSGLTHRFSRSSTPSPSSGSSTATPPPPPPPSPPPAPLRRGRQYAQAEGFRWPPVWVDNHDIIRHGPPSPPRPHTSPGQIISEVIPETPFAGYEIPETSGRDLIAELLIPHTPISPLILVPRSPRQRRNDTSIIISSCAQRHVFLTDNPIV